MKELRLLAVAFVVSVTLKGCEPEEDSYSCQADKFDCWGLDDFCNEKERLCKSMKWSCRDGKLVCDPDDGHKDMCAQLNVDCSKEKDSSLGKDKGGSSFIQVGSLASLDDDTSPRAVIHRHRKNMISIGA